MFPLVVCTWCINLRFVDLFLLILVKCTEHCEKPSTETLLTFISRPDLPKCVHHDSSWCKHKLSSLMPALTSTWHPIWKSLVFFDNSLLYTCSHSSSWSETSYKSFRVRLLFDSPWVLQLFFKTFTIPLGMAFNILLYCPSCLWVGVIWRVSTMFPKLLKVFLSASHIRLIFKARFWIRSKSYRTVALMLTSWFRKRNSSNIKSVLSGSFLLYFNSCQAFRTSW